MAKYRKKPVVIEAFQWFGDHRQEEDPEWIVEAIKRSEVYFVGQDMLINTLEGTMTCDEGDYVIQGVKGEIYPCKPDIFALTYEKVED
jgi:hypothetical protein